MPRLRLLEPKTEFRILLTFVSYNSCYYCEDSRKLAYALDPEMYKESLSPKQRGNMPPHQYIAIINSPLAPYQAGPSESPAGSIRTLGVPPLLPRPALVLPRSLLKNAVGYNSCDT